MELKDIQNDLQIVLSPKRFRHSRGVAETARHLAEKYGADAHKAYAAGWVHDCAKELSLTEMQHIVQEAGIKADKYLLSSRALLHGPAGSVLTETKYGISDRDIQSAVYFHTTGHPDMTLLEKIIFLADYIEPSRDFPGVDKLRKLAEIDLDEALLAAYDSTISHLLDQKAYIYDLTFTGRNDLILKLKEKTNENK
ncbi:bis(5'-nucleosyl)-tetraphosphatase (symmetrical) YqeK [uncultured Dialister sp.]|uniref:bis(5'-nucleosyl)-tetraphosphatase (symmetrical) YqeK n=1 Tax=uncultured Dialister sp. TaxID=278064 RepID=UPI00262B9506|nr:bis(5'-nucleosyl)-tetraphosphatase (symmetrical) YqeK [uncultured Dialister sp.]